MKIAIYSPYLDTFGGGEKYMMTIAEVLSRGNTVEVLLDGHLNQLGGEYLRLELSKRFDLNLKQTSFIKAPIGKNASPLSRSLFLKQYNLLFYLTDGSIFYPTSKKNILHIQTPLAGEARRSIWGKFKLTGWDLIIYNSQFTKQYSEKNWPIKSEVVYPPIDVGKIKPLTKKKYILSVGRFFGYLKGKKQELLIKVFRNLHNDKLMKDWSLHLVGSAGKGDKDYLDELKNEAKGVPINFYPNLGYDNFVKLYGESSIYWHAAGFGEGDPVKMEHFGISTVEAMAAGCVPVVINKGGQREIVEQGKSGFRWDSISQLKKFTLELIKDQVKRKKIAEGTINRAKQFSKDKFTQNIRRIVNENK